MTGVSSMNIYDENIELPAGPGSVVGEAVNISNTTMLDRTLSLCIYNGYILTLYIYDILIPVGINCERCIHARPRSSLAQRNPPPN